METVNAYRILLVVFVTLLFFKTGNAKKKCLPQVNKIPMQKKFNMTKFAGTWYTVSRTKYAWQENTYESASIEFGENADGSFTYSLTGQLDGKCLPVETGALELGPRKAQFVLRGPDATPANPTMVVSYTDYNTALIYFCFRYRPGRKDQCQQKSLQAEIMSRSTQVKKRTVKEYLKRMQKRLCISPKDVFPTKPGICKIPDILAQAKERDLAENDLIVDASKKHCAVNNIPVQKNFQLPEMEGLWYEIARTRFTFNKMESVISYHRYDSDNDLIKSFYTGTTKGNCSTPIQGTSRTKQGAKFIGDMEGKIDGASFYWSPLKILYVDANYLMFYACYSGDSDKPCIKEAMEVTLTGRAREISEKEKKHIYKMLPQICVDPADMVDTEFAENCTHLVENVLRDKEMDPSSCILDDIPVHDDYDDISMQGEWFLYGHVNYTDTGLVMGSIVNISGGPVQSFMVKQAPFVKDSHQPLKNIYSRQRCLDTGDYITTLPGEKENGWVFSKILYQDDNTFVDYICTQRNLDGRCNVDGVQAFIYTRNKTLTEVSEEHINKALKSACINPDDIVKTEEWSDFDTLGTEEVLIGSDMCDIDNIAIFNDIDDFDQTKIYGYWYEIAHSRGIHSGNMESFTAYFTSDTNVTLQIYYSGLLENGSFVPVDRATAIPRCLNELNGDYLTEIPSNTRDSDTISFIPMKVLFTDYDVLLTFICQEMLPDGRCSDSGSHIRLWSRNISMDDDTRDYVMDFASWACIDTTTKDENFLVDTKHNASVFPKLEEYVLENVYEHEYELVEEEITNEAKEEQADETEPIFDEFEDELQRYLDMTSEEFYYSDK